MITVELVARKLLAYPKLIGALEQVVFEQEETLRERRNQYLQREAKYLLQENGPINGKNEQIRSAQLYSLVTPERILIEIAEKEVAQSKLQLAVEKNCYRSWTMIAQMLARLERDSLDAGQDDG